MLHYRRMQRWYSLGFEMQGTTPVILIDIFRGAEGLLRDTCRTHYLANDLFFERNLEKGFGTDNCIIRDAEDEPRGYMRFVARLEKDNRAARNMTVVADALEYIGYRADKDVSLTDPHREQLVWIRFSSDGKRASISGSVSSACADWIPRLAQRRHETAVRMAMLSVWNALSEFPLARNSMGGAMGIGVLVTKEMTEKGGFVLQTCGNACDLSTADWWRRDADAGHELVEHNVDSSIQALSLLSGLAQMHALADRDIEKGLHKKKPPR